MLQFYSLFLVVETPFSLNHLKSKTIISTVRERKETYVIKQCKLCRDYIFNTNYSDSKLKLKVLLMKSKEATPNTATLTF